MSSDDDPSTTPDSAPVTIVDADESGRVRSGDRGLSGDEAVSDQGLAADGSDVTTGAEQPSDSPEKTDSASATSVTPVPAPAASTGGPDADWHELQGRFVDDPEAAVREAGALVEKAFSELRARSESGSTEDLRTAFRRYRDLYANLT